MYKCEICGRGLKKKNRVSGYTVCPKHMHQIRKYGHAIDSNPRSEKDLNEFRIINDKTVEFDVYNIKSEVMGHFIIDREDLKKIRYHKWRMSTNHRIITGNCTNKSPRRELSRFLLDVTDANMVVDHINGDPSDNRKSNLRVCTQNENLFNKSFMSNSLSGIIGVIYDKKRRKWAPEIQKNEIRVHLGRYNELNEAVYVRDYAKRLLFEEFRNTNKDPEKEKMFEIIPENRKSELKEYVYEKLKKRFELP